jgi:hypothetical protein
MIPRTVFLEPVAANLDTSSARRFGLPIILFPDGLIEPIDSGFRAKVIDKLDAIGYNPETDYLVISGRLSKVCLAWATVADTYEGVAYLVYSERTKGYEKVRLCQLEQPSF